VANYHQTANVKCVVLYCYKFNVNRKYLKTFAQYRRYIEVGRPFLLTRSVIQPLA